MSTLLYCSLFLFTNSIDFPWQLMLSIHTFRILSPFFNYFYIQIAESAALASAPPPMQARALSRQKGGCPIRNHCPKKRGHSRSPESKPVVKTPWSCCTIADQRIMGNLFPLLLEGGGA